MFKNYLKTALRNIVRHKLYALVNILGLAIGITCFIMMGLWVQDELSFDRGFKNAERIYRISNNLITNDVPSKMTQADPRIANHIKADYPEIEQVARMIDAPALISTRNKQFFEAKTYFADTTFFKIFTYDFIEGDPATAFNNINDVVITASIAKELFGGESAVGKTISITTERIKRPDARIERTISGVIKDNFGNAHFYPKVIAAKYGYMDMFEFTYVLFRKGYNPKVFEEKVWPEINEKWYREEYGHDEQALTLNLQPLTSIHLTSHLLSEHEPSGNMDTVYACSAIAFLILLIASINYMNLATSRFQDRSREVGIRKIIGATRKQIILQFLTEAIGLSFMALIVALALVEITLPHFNHLSGKRLQLNVLEPLDLIIVFTLTVMVGFISGLYPAFFASRTSPVAALKEVTDVKKGNAVLRKSLVVLQFSVSIIMLVATMIISRQLSYVKAVNLGFNKEQVLIVNLKDAMMNGRTELLKTALLKNRSILSVAASHNSPGTELYQFYHKFETKSGELKAKLTTTMLVDYDYHHLLGLKFTAGKPFDTAMVRLIDSGVMFYILNESAVKMLGWQDPIGRKILTGNSGGNKMGYCVGVVKDFHTASLHEPIKPVVFRLAKKRFQLISVKVKPQNMRATVAFIKNTMAIYSPGYPFQYSFLDDAFNKQYEREEKQTTIYEWLAGLCIFISCLGLMGLTSFTTSKRNKEISIRKIAGASVYNILWLLAKDFLKPVLIALLVAIPIAWYMMDWWLHTFAYHIPISPTPFLFAGTIAIIIALLTISIHTIQAANRSPATVLKYE